MDIDPKIFQQLIDTFTLELEEQLQLITQGLVKLERISIQKERKPPCIRYFVQLIILKVLREALVL